MKPRTLKTLNPTWRFMVVVSGGICPLVWVISIVTLLITPFVTTHEPPSRVPWTFWGFRVWASGWRGPKRLRGGD